MLIEVDSDFLTSDVQFVLFHEFTNRLYIPQERTENSKKLLISDIKSTRFRLIIYTRSYAGFGNYHQFGL
jgi:hypothetical protein